MLPLIANEPFDLVSMDFVGPFQKTASGNRWILTITEHFAHYAAAIPTKTMTAEEVAEELAKYFFRMGGPPKTLLSDRGPQFESELIRRLCKYWGIDKVRTTSYYPAGDGLCERYNKVLADSLYDSV